MKKFLAISLAAIMIAATFTMAVSALIDLANEDIRITVDNAAAAPVIDGVLDADSYGKISTAAGDFLYYDDDEYDPWLQANVPDFYLSYDANNLYVFLSGNLGDGNKYYYCEHEGDDTGNIWNQSCIQISLATADAEGSDRLEFGLARNHTTGEKLSNIWAQGSDSNGKDEYEMVLGQNCDIVLDGNRISYEVSIPWTTFLPAAPKAGDSFGLNFMFGWSEDGNRFGVEYSSGCNKSKDAALFSTVTLTDNVLQAAPAVEYRGVETLAEATSGKSALMNPEYIAGGEGFNDAEGSASLLVYDEASEDFPKYCSNQYPYWAEWKYDGAYVVNSVILRTGGDSADFPRRPADGWTLSGSNDGSSWNVIYTGKADDIEDANLLYYPIDLSGNGAAYQYYRFNADGSNPGQEQDIIQLSMLVLTGTAAAGDAGGGSTPPPVVTETPSTTPPTGDNVLMIFATLMIAAAAAVVLKKKAVK